ncbi:MAG: ribonuclease Z [Gemmatimonadales bacterium]|nr:MAG: ribonuclease Z [Gemmatimonadales bacterium]
MNARFTVVGCGTVVPEATTGGSSFLLDTGSVVALLDCGPGTIRTLETLGLRWAGITDILLTHFHTDHVGGLPGLLFSLTHGLLPDRRAEPLTVWGPPGTRAMFTHLTAALGAFMLDPGFPLRVIEIEAGETHKIGEQLLLRSISTPHTEESLAFRLEGEGISVVYSGDTGPDVDMGGFATGCDLFVCECSLPEDFVGENHLSPTAVARFASSAAPGLLLLTHVYPQFRSTADVINLVRVAGFRGTAELAFEGWSRVLPLNPARS